MALEAQAEINRLTQTPLVVSPDPPIASLSADALTDQLVRRAPQRRDEATPLGETVEDIAKLASAAGYMTRRRASELDRVDRNRRERDRQDLVEKLRAASGVWPQYAGASIADVEFPRRVLTQDEFSRYGSVRDELTTLLAAPGLLVLSGDNGPGKTHLASSLVHAFCDAARPAFYCTALDFYRKLASTFGAPGRTSEDLIIKFRRYELLVLDEIEVRPEKPWHDNELRDLINARDGHLVSTVLCTNKSERELIGDPKTATVPYLSRAIIDRLCRSGGILRCDWPSLRGR